jgi:hypothetical protein
MSWALWLRLAIDGGLAALAVLLVWAAASNRE